MRRNVDGEWTRNLIEKMRNRIPGVVLRTTMMVGHPGEGEKEFEELNAEKAALEQALSGGQLPVDELRKASTRFGELTEIIDGKEMRWLELSELA